MNQATPSTLADAIRLSLLVPALTAALLLLAAGRTLTPDDVAWLTGTARASGLLAIVVGGWEGFVGTLEQPARLLGLVATLVTAIAVGIVAARGGARSALVALLGLAAMPLLWLDGTGIGTSMPITAVVAVLAATAAGLFGRDATFAGRTALLLAIALPFGLALGKRDHDGFLALPAEHQTILAALTAAWLLATAFILLRFGARRSLAIADVALLGAAVAAPFAAEALGLGGLDTSLRTAVLPGAAWLLAGTAHTRGPSAAPTIAAILLVLSAASFAVVHDAVSTDEIGDPRESLDWIRDHVDVRAIALGVGPRSGVDAFHEERGHRTGHVWYRPASPDALARLLSNAVSTKAPMLVVMGEDATVRPKLSDHYEELPLEGAPADIAVYAWRRR